MCICYASGFQLVFADGTPNTLPTIAVFSRKHLTALNWFMTDHGSEMNNTEGGSPVNKQSDSNRSRKINVYTRAAHLEGVYGTPGCRGTLVGNHCVTQWSVFVNEKVVYFQSVFCAYMLYRHSCTFSLRYHRTSTSSTYIYNILRLLLYYFL
jgi:hypothetical protein